MTDEQKVRLALDAAIKVLENRVEQNDGCPWCKNEYTIYTIIDDDFGQPLHPNMIKYCFSCGRPLKGE